MKSLLFKFPVFALAFLAFSITSCEGISDFLDGEDDDDDYCCCEDNGTASCEEDETIINAADLPTSILEYISTNFPTETILLATYETDEPEEAYEVLLSNGIELYFNQDGAFTSQEEHDDDDDDEVFIDASALPASILEYITLNFPAETIVLATYEENDPAEAYEVLLSNGIELYFDQEGGFVSQDDDNDCDCDCDDDDDHDKDDDDDNG